jgi:hypothetical protein
VDLDEFARELEKVIGRPTDLRPFVCEGSPLDCDVFLVGIEPATAMQADFWDFWGSDGFDKQKWVKQYRVERAKKGKPRPSPTRDNIEHFVRGAAGSRVLETNISAQASERYDRKNIPHTAAFQFLLNVIKPRVLHVHGEPAWKAIGRFNPSGKILKEYHLSYQTGEDKAFAFGKRAAEISRTMLRSD